MKTTLVEAESCGIHSLTNAFIPSPIHSFIQCSLAWSLTVSGYLAAQSVDINELPVRSLLATKVLCSLLSPSPLS